MLTAYTKGLYKDSPNINEIRTRLQREQDERVFRIQSFLGNSPFSSFYTSSPVSLDSYLTLPDVSQAPNFHQALNVYFNLIGDSSARVKDFSETAGIDPKTSLVAHLKNNSGRSPNHRFGSYDPKMRPAISLKHFARLGLSDESHTPEEGWGRIPILLYDGMTGKLLLSQDHGKNTLVQAKKLLSESGQNYRSPDRGAAGQSRRRFLGRTIRDFMRTAFEVPPFPKDDFDFTRDRKMYPIWSRLDALGIVPVFLAPPFPDAVLEIESHKLEAHIQSLQELPKREPKPYICEHLNPQRTVLRETG